MLRRVALIALVATMTACGGGGNGASEEPGGGSGSDELVVQSASYDLAVGDETRYIAGILTPDQLFVSYGEVDMDFFYLGTQQGSGTAEPGPETTARFLTIEGDPTTEGPVAGPVSQGRGVYATDVTFDRAGYWAVEVSADLDGESRSGRAVFEVQEEHKIPAVGDAAPKTKNLTVSSDAPARAVDSRAESEGQVPDKGLHQATVAGSIERREPALVVIATPVYCVSRFCGPITDMIGELEKDYGNRANFVHIEVWWNFQKQVVNRGAAQWILRGQDLTEPWVFLIGRDGKIEARWDNVATREEIEPLLRELPPLD